MMNQIKEEWLEIAGYDGKYQVSNLGRVKSLFGKERILKSSISAGYHQVVLCKNGKTKHHTIHRLVAETFIQNPDNLPQVNHKDENKENNCVENLEWCDPKYNINYGTARERTVKNMTGPMKSKPVLCVETGKIYPSLHQAARQTGAHFKNISACCRGKINTSGGYHWKYSD